MAQLVKAPFDLITTLFDRMTKPQVLDALLAVYGEKGSGKSEGCMYIADRLDKRLCKHFKKPEGYFFSINNVRSVDKEGTLEMFTNKQLKEKYNQVFIIDDASIASNARSFHTPENQRLNAIMTVARIYRHCVILNTVDPDLIDKVLRNFANITCVATGPDMNPVSPTYKINRFRVYSMSRAMAPALKNRRHYNKSFTFYDKNQRLNRVVSMRVGRAPPELLGQYEALRKEKTDKLIDDLFTPLDGNENDFNTNAVPKMGKREKQLRDDFDTWNMIIRQSLDKNDGKMKITELITTTGLSREKIQRIVGMIHAGYT